MIPVAAPPSHNQKLDIDLPPGAVPGDKLTFTVTNRQGLATTFSAVVPPPAQLGLPMKKISVTVPVPAAYGIGTPLQVAKMFLGGGQGCPWVQVGTFARWRRRAC